MVKRQRLEVIVDEIDRPGDSSVIMITGGGLQPGIAWVPVGRDLIRDAHGLFVTVGASSHGLYTFCNTPLRRNTFLHDLQTERNQKSVEVLDAKGIELFGIDAASTRTKREDLRRKLLTEYEKEIPVVIELTFDGLTAPMRVRLDMDRRKCVAIELTVPNLEFVAQRVADTTGQCDARKKQAAQERKVFKYPEIRMSSHRDSMYCKYFDDDGKLRTKTHPMDPKLEGAGFDEAVESASESLHEFFVINNKHEHADMHNEEDNVIDNDS